MGQYGWISTKAIHKHCNTQATQLSLERADLQSMNENVFSLYIIVLSTIKQGVDWTWSTQELILFSITYSHVHLSLVHNNDAGAASVMSIMSATRKSSFFY